MLHIPTSPYTLDRRRLRHDRTVGRVVLLAVVLATPIIAIEPVAADVIILKNGGEIRGQVIRELDELIEIELPYGRMMLRRAEIDRIEKESESDFLGNTGRNLLRFDDHSRAVDYLTRAYEAKPTDANKRALKTALTEYAQHHWERHRYQKVRPILDRALALDPDDATLEKLDHEWTTRIAVRDEKAAAANAARGARDYARAFALYGELMQDYPEFREDWRASYAQLAIHLGHQSFKQSDFARARTLYRLAIAQDADFIGLVRAPLAFAEVQTVIPILESGDHQQARQRMLDARQLLPDDPAVTYYLAVAEESTGRLTEAAELYAILAGPNRDTISSAQHVQSLRRAAESALARSQTIQLAIPQSRWASFAKKPGRLDGKHFVLHYSVPERAHEVERQLEYQLTTLKRQWFGGIAVLKKKVDVYLHPDRDSFRAAVHPPEWSTAVTRHEKRFGKLLGHEMHFDASSPQLESSTLPHELCHVMLRYLINPGGSIPLWIDEGLATTREPSFKQRHYDRIVCDAIDAGTTFTIDDLTSLRNYPPPDRARLYYAQSNSLTRFLIARLGWRRSLAFFDAFAKSSPEKALAKHTSYVNLQQLEKAWLRWFKENRR